MIHLHVESKNQTIKKRKKKLTDTENINRWLPEAGGGG